MLLSLNSRTKKSTPSSILTLQRGFKRGSIFNGLQLRQRPHPLCKSAVLADKKCHIVTWLCAFGALIEKGPGTAAGPFFLAYTLPQVLAEKQTSY
jgi:hypothetical protein